MGKRSIILVAVAALFLTSCALEIKKPDILEDETSEESLNHKCSAEFHEGSYYERSDPFDEMSWMNGRTVHIENLDEHGFDIFVTDDSPEGGGEVILERRRAVFEATGYEAVCKADPETDVFPEESVIRIFLIESGRPAAVTGLVLFGFEPCQWEVFLNNRVPGHEFN